MKNFIKLWKCILFLFTLYCSTQARYMLQSKYEEISRFIYITCSSKSTGNCFLAKVKSKLAACRTKSANICPNIRTLILYCNAGTSYIDLSILYIDVLQRAREGARACVYVHYACACMCAYVCVRALSRAQRQVSMSTFCAVSDIMRMCRRHCKARAH